MIIKFLILLLPVILFSMTQEQWIEYAKANAAAESRKQDREWRSLQEYREKKEEIQRFKDNQLQCGAVLSDEIKIYKENTICSNNDDSEVFLKKYFKCTLIQKNCKHISNRVAKTMNEDDYDLILQETEALFAKNSYSFSCKGKNGTDVYKNWDYPNIFLNKKNQFIFYKEGSLEEKEEILIYECQDASFFEKMKMKASHF